MRGLIFVYTDDYSDLSRLHIRSQVCEQRDFLSVSDPFTERGTYAIIVSHSDKPMDSVTVQPEAVTILRELLEDSVAHWCEGEFMNGTPVSGETAWKIIECLAVAKQAQFKGEIE